MMVRICKYSRRRETKFIFLHYLLLLFSSVIHHVAKAERGMSLPYLENLTRSLPERPHLAGQVVSSIDKWGPPNKQGKLGN